jgi:hypothetical protein
MKTKDRGEIFPKMRDKMEVNLKKATSSLE